MNKLSLRLAFRMDGNFWVATMEGNTAAQSYELARVHGALVEDDGMRMAYLDVLRRAFTKLAENATGATDVESFLLKVDPDKPN